MREADRLAAAAKTVVWFAEGGEAVGIAAIADRIRPGAAQAVAELRAMGLDVRLLTGDNEATARAIAAEAGITACEAGVRRTGRPPISAACRPKGTGWRWSATGSTTARPWHRPT